jgi:glycolate oxidase
MGYQVSQSAPDPSASKSLDYSYRRLVNTLGPERVARSEFERMVYSHDFASLPKIALLQWRLYPDFVVLPQTTEEVSALVKLSDESLLPIVPRGGGTGWCGGSVPNRGGVLFDMRKMNHILSLDPDRRVVTVEAGATWRDLEDYVEARGFALRTVPMNAIGSTIGGAINSGTTGFGGLRGGSLRDALVNLEVVLPDGSALWTAPVADGGGNLGNLTDLFVGAEGTLGIITKAVLRLTPRPDISKPIPYAFPELVAAARFLKGIVDAGLAPYHAALIDRDHFVFERAIRPGGLEPTHLALVSVQGTKEDVADQEKTLDGIAATHQGSKLPPAVGDTMWRDRHNNYSARRLSRGLTISYNLVPLRRLPEAVETAARIRRKLKLNGSVQAHLVDTTTAALTPYVLMDDTKPSGGTALGFVKRMGDAAFKMDGHPMGLGLFLVFNLRKMHGSATSAYSSVKTVFDPRKKINGGKTFEVWTKYPWPGLRAIPPPGMAFGLELAAILRRMKPTRDRYVRAYKPAKEG